MQIQRNVSLKPYNTFGIDASASYFSSFSSAEELEFLFADKNLPRKRLVIGGGSNILILKDIDGLVLQNRIKGIELISENADHYYVKAGAGEKWNDLVQYCITHGYAGIENLSLIPGNTGAAPMQNIGAYGVELKETFLQLDAYHIESGKIMVFSNNDCEFGYRDSIFKRQAKDQFIILTITLRLNKTPRLNTEYGAIKQELQHMGVHEISIKSISDAVVNIRRSKLPDPAVIGNAGSFFKNPVVENKKYQGLKMEYPDLPGFATGSAETTKIPAAYLIEKCGWKGYRNDDAGCHVKQPLVLVNYGNARGQEIYDLSEAIMESVMKTFGIRLEREVNLCQ